MSTTNLNEMQINELKEAFALLNPSEPSEDNGGEVTFTGLAELLKKLDQHPTEIELKDMMVAIGGDRDGKVNWEDFLAAMGPQMDNANTEEEVLEVFRPFDQDGDGYVTEAKTREIIKALLGDKLKDEELEEIMRVEAKPDMFNMVRYEDFVKVLMAGGIEED
mmetsp:Transcript_6386/g.9378  ORF Transcript_6386/g.9378 Transcript_6386/m.9378 type:complete len:163 (+) Transcript_6386:56-544(+)|eukprot:CAMPEP_0197247030 /NCGR_PEP_ID=MMETSP1429-20130617/25988_1 /TAXON_ID=49237 /ORGANISM="Chaetoceros  sp., Strain UNC1202" /LENGTH=162 /DNA_ID=CAMNT_0042707835 /DNA_START=55 /DNA_END=543 /DNA_ORIENTATION=+